MDIITLDVLVELGFIKQNSLQLYMVLPSHLKIELYYYATHCKIRLMFDDDSFQGGIALPKRFETKQQIEQLIAALS